MSLVRVCDGCKQQIKENEYIHVSYETDANLGSNIVYENEFDMCLNCLNQTFRNILLASSVRK